MSGQRHLKSKILKINDEVIKKFGVDRGMTHAEFYLTDHGPVFGEIAIRPPGGYYMELIEKVYGATNYFPGDLLPNTTAYLANEVYTATYTARPSIAADITMLIIHKQDFPIMSAFSVGTSFFNAKTLATNHYLTFGHNDVYDAHLRERALLKIATDVA